MACNKKYKYAVGILCFGRLSGGGNAGGFTPVDTGVRLIALL